MVGNVWPLVGRDAEVRYCGRVLDAGSGLVLAGRAGVGKSRLAREVAARGDAGGGVVSAIGTVAAREIPYGAFAHLGRGSFNADDFVAEMTNAGRARRLLLVDDAHLLDPRSAALLLTLRQRDVTMVLTVRSGQPCPDAVQLLWKDGYLDRVELEPLSRNETADLLREVLGAPLVSSALERLFAAAEGNPLYLSHLVAAARAAGDLVEEASAWHWRGRTLVSPSLRELVGTEIGALDQLVRRTLEYVAFAEPMEYDLLSTLVGGAPIRDATDRELIVLDVRGHRTGVRFGHPLYGELVRDGATPGEQRIRRRELADAALGFDRRRVNDDLRLAVWLLDSGGCDDLDLLFRAGLVARQYADTPVVERLAEAGLAVGGGFNFLLGRAFAHRFRAEFAEATEVYAELWAMAQDDDERTLVLNAQPMMTFFQMDDEAAAIDILSEQERGITSAPGKLLAHGLGAMFLASTGELGSARAIAEAVLREWRELADPAEVARTAPPTVLERPVLAFVPDARILAASMVALIAVAEGDTDVGIEFAAGAREMCYSSSGPMYWLLAGWIADRCERLWGDRYASERRANELVELARSLAPGSAAGSVAMLSAVSSLGRGRPHDALVAAADARAGLIVGDLGNFRFHVANVEAVASAVLGDAQRASEAVERAAGRWQQNVAFFAPDFAIAKAWAGWVNGRAGQAMGLLRDESARARDDGRWGDALELDHEALRLGDATAIERVLEACPHVTGPLSNARALHAKGLEQGDGPALIEAAEAFEAMGADLLAMDAMAHAATVSTAQGLRARAQEAATKMRTLRQHCDGAETPATRVAAAPPELTRREAEIAVLVAEGLSNQAIADRLVVSRRTVESHLARVFAKLGVKAREDVARAIGLG